MSDTPTLSTEDLAGLAQIVANFSEMSTVILEAASGYRAKCVEAGYSPTAAEQMSVQYHDQVLSLFMDGVREAQRQQMRK